MTAAESRDATRLLRTLCVLATLEGRAVPDQRIWDAADINKITWKAYDDLLHRTLTRNVDAAWPRTHAIAMWSIEGS